LTTLATVDVLPCRAFTLNTVLQRKPVHTSQYCNAKSEVFAMGCSIDNYCHRRGGDISCRRVIPRLIVRQPAAAAASGRQRSTTRAEFVERCRTHARCGTMTSRPHVTAAMMDDQPARGQRRRHIIALCTAELIIAWPTRHERGRQRERERERGRGEL